MNNVGKKMISVMIVVAITVTSLFSPDLVSAAKKPKLATKSIVVNVNKSKTIKVTKKKGFKISFKSAAKKTAIVSKNGKVTGKKGGKTKITVYYKKGKSAKKKLGTVTVTINKKKVATPKPTVQPIATIKPTQVPTQAPTQAPTQVPTEMPSAGPTEMPTQNPDLFAVADYPTLFSDIPDLDIIHVNGSFYMVSTTMNMCPGAPIMKSTDLVHWQIVNYVYDTYIDDDRANLRNEKHMYTNGSWAASLKYNEEDGKYYVAFNTNGHGFYIYSTDDIENGTWVKHHISTAFHDPGLFFEDGKIYVLYGSGSLTIQEVTLNDEEGKVERVGDGKKIIQPTGWGLWEGAHVYKIDNYYYIMIIASPNSGWFRTQLCYRSEDLFSTEWEEKIVYKGGSGGAGEGLAQGGLVQTMYGDWYGFLFQDHGAIGRIPSILAVEWQDEWPMMGTYDENGDFQVNKSEDPLTIRLNDSGLDNYFYGDDDFSYEEDERLKLVWQWNHNPRNDYWSVTDRPGYMRLTTDETVANVLRAHNSLTQRTYGPKCVSETKVSVKEMKSGDYAGLCAVGGNYAEVGVMSDENGDKYIYQGNGIFPETKETNPSDPKYSITVNGKTTTKLDDDAEVYLKIQYDFSFTRNSKVDKASFYYSLDGTTWTEIGKQLQMSFSTSTTFMGARTWLFNYSTQEAGGYVDFDYYKTYTW